MRELQTERILLRYFRLADTEPIHGLIYSDPEVYQWWGGEARTQEEVEERVLLWMHSAQAGSFGNLAVIRKEDDRVLGFVALQAYVASIRLAEEPASPCNSLEVELSYALGRDYWGKGYAYEACLPMIAEAFQELKLRRLVNGITPENRRSMALAQRLGFREERNCHPDDSSSVWVLDNNIL